jgi:hypothetical protein
VLDAPFAHRDIAADREHEPANQNCYSPPHGLHPDQIFSLYNQENAQMTEWWRANRIKFAKFSVRSAGTFPFRQPGGATPQLATAATQRASVRLRQNAV